VVIISSFFFAFSGFSVANVSSLSFRVLGGSFSCLFKFRVSVLSFLCFQCLQWLIFLLLCVLCSFLFFTISAFSAVKIGSLTSAILSEFRY